jgi:hypothetical protein
MGQGLMSEAGDGKMVYSIFLSMLNQLYRYAVERTPQFIKIWFWSRQNPSVPWEVKYASLNNKVNTDHLVRGFYIHFFSS